MAKFGKTKPKMLFVFHLIICACLFVFEINSGDSKCDNSILSRHKRYVVFPEGSSLSIAFCITTGSLTVAPTIFTQSVNWILAYDLPNDTSILKAQFTPKHTMQRRHRRDLYEKIELVMDSMGLDGRACILRTLCEIEQRILPNGADVIEELLRIVFRFPWQLLHNSEPEIHRLYQWARRMGHENQDCATLFPACQFSLLDLIYGLKPDG